MKKYLMSTVVVVLAIASSAFTTVKNNPEKGLVDYYWFNVNTNQGDDNSLTNSQVSYIGFGSSTPVGTCDQVNNYNCKVGFTSGQVELVDGTYRLQSGEQSIATVAHRRTLK